QIAATSSIASRDKGGNSPIKRCANILLPTPGGPFMSTLWPPAAATNKPYLACCCPCTSEKHSSDDLAGLISSGKAEVGSRSAVNRSCTNACKLLAPYTQRADTKAISLALL